MSAPTSAYNDNDNTPGVPEVAGTPNTPNTPNTAPPPGMSGGGPTWITLTPYAAAQLGLAIWREVTEQLVDEDGDPLFASGQISGMPSQVALANLAQHIYATGMEYAKTGHAPKQWQTPMSTNTPNKVR